MLLYHFEGVSLRAAAPQVLREDEEEEMSTKYNGSTENCLHSKEHGQFIH